MLWGGAGRISGCFVAAAVALGACSLVVSPDELITGSGAASTTVACADASVGSYVCEAGKRFRCTGAASSREDPCPADTPVCVASACVSCNPGATRCADGVAERCSEAGAWQLLERCSLGCADAGCVECKAGERVCDGLVAAVCGNDGTWNRTTCPGQCVDGACVVCPANGTRCEGKTYQSCGDAGTYQTIAECPFACSPTIGCTGVCEPGHTKCEGTGTVTCDATGQYPVSPTPCATGSCAGGKCSTCTPGALRCAADRNRQVCSSDGSAWVDDASKICPYQCVDGACVGTCNVGETQCSRMKDAVEECQLDANGAGAWTTSRTCTTACIDAGDGRPYCGTCKPDSTECTTATGTASLRRCTSKGEWGSLSPCQAQGSTCDASKIYRVFDATCADARACGQLERSTQDCRELAKPVCVLDTSGVFSFLYYLSTPRVTCSATAGCTITGEDQTSCFRAECAGDGVTSRFYSGQCADGACVVGTTVSCTKDTKYCESGKLVTVVADGCRPATGTCDTTTVACANGCAAGACL